jgi:sRNA-binding carbon storage regulator CsrA
MLVVSRKNGEKIVLTSSTERIEIVVCEITNLARVRIGVHASSDWQIVRESSQCQSNH